MAASGWGTAGLIETDNASDPQVAVDGSGNVVAVWHQWDGTRSNVWANRYVAGTGWGTAGLIETDNAGDAFPPQVAVDPSGNAVAVWYQSDGTRYNIWANRYVAGTGWGTAGLIETDNVGDAYAAQVAVDGSGDAVAVWYQYDGSRNNIWANRYVAGTGWATAGLIETDAGDAFFPRVAVDGSGNAVAVWQQSDGTRNNIWANRYVARIGWGTAGLIETDNAGDAYIPQVAVDGSGDAVVVWTQSDGTRGNIWANRYVAGTGWGTAGLIETDNAGSAVDPQVAVDGSGNAVAVWPQFDGTRYNIWANRYVAGTGWGTAGLIETENLGDAGAPQVAVDGSGNAVAVWYQSDGVQFSIWANRYLVRTGWGTAGLIETDNGGAAFSPEVAVDGSGNAVAVWSQWDGSRYNIWANRLVEDYPPALVLYSPFEGLSANRSTVWVGGASEPGATVSVNGVAVSVASDGSFGIELALAPGANLINATAWDRAGNRASVSRNVTFNDPLPALEQDLAAAQTSLAATQSELAATQAALAVAEADLTQDAARIVALESNASAAKAELNLATESLASAQVSLTAAQARVTALEAAAAQTQVDLSTARADLTSAQSRITALETKQTSTQTDLVEAKAQSAAASAQAAAASAQVGLAMALAAVGIVLAAVASILAMRNKNKASPKDAADLPPPASKEPPPK